MTLLAVDDDEDKGISVEDVLLTSVSSLDSLADCQAAGRSHCTRASAYSAVSVSSQSVTVIDNDVAGVSLSSGAIDATFDNYGDPLHVASFTLCLTSRPLAAVTLTLSGLTNWSTASTSKVTFAPDAWNVPVTVSVSAVRLRPHPHL